MMMMMVGEKYQAKSRIGNWQRKAERAKKGRRRTGAKPCDNRDVSLVSASHTPLVVYSTNVLGRKPL